MSKDLKELQLTELMELHAATKMLADKYGNELTTYAEVNKDSNFYRITSNEKGLFQRHKELTDLIVRINNRIQEIVDEYIYKNE